MVVRYSTSGPDLNASGFEGTPSTLESTLVNERDTTVNLYNQEVGGVSKKAKLPSGLRGWMTQRGLGNPEHRETAFDLFGERISRIQVPRFVSVVGVAGNDRHWILYPQHPPSPAPQGVRPILAEPTCQRTFTSNTGRIRT